MNNIRVVQSMRFKASSYIVETLKALKRSFDNPCLYITNGDMGLARVAEAAGIPWRKGSRDYVPFDVVLFFGYESCKGMISYYDCVSRDFPTRLYLLDESKNSTHVDLLEVGP